MAEEQEQQECKCPPGAPMWMATFSDMMTLLLTFFVLLLSMANMDPIKLTAGTKSISSAFASVHLFRNNTIIGEPNHELVMIPSPIFQEKVSKDKSPSKEKEMENINDKHKKKDSQENTEQSKAQEAGKQQTDAVAMAQQKEMNEIDKNVQMTFKDDISKGAINFKSEQERIIIEYPAEDSFKSGSAELTDKMKRASQKLAFLLKDRNVLISIAGYTDSIPIRTAKFRNNWDLSAMRASSVATEMTKYVKFSPEQIEVRGYGEGHPKASNSTAAGRKLNRRLEIVIEPDKSKGKLMEGASIDTEKGKINYGGKGKKSTPVSTADTVNKEKLLQRIR